MRLSRESRYALIGMIALGSKPEGTVVGANELAQEADLPAPFMAKILQRLTRRGLLVSHRGRVRGYEIARRLDAITVSEVLEAIDGEDALSRCLFVSESCDASKPCPLHEVWQPMADVVALRLRRMKLADVDPRTVGAEREIPHF